MYIDEFIKSTEVKEMLSEVRNAISENEDLARHSDELSHILYVKRDKQKFLEELGARRENIKLHLGDLSRVFSLCIYEKGLDALVHFYKSKKIPDEILINTMNDLNIWIGNYYVQHGKYGFDEDVWLVHHVLGDIYSLGRLQFAFAKYQHNTEVYKSGDDIVVAAVKDLPINKDGEYTNSDDMYIKTAYEKTVDNTLLAHLVNTDTGIIELTPKEIDLQKYKLVLKKDDDVLAVHIPATGRMDYEECLKSFEMAKVFFKEYFPHYEFKAFTCDSWLLSNEIREMVSENSNIYKFLSLFKKYISRGTHAYIYKWIFGFDCTDVLKAKTTSSLTQKVQQLVAGGHDIYSRGGFITL